MSIDRAQASQIAFTSQYGGKFSINGGHAIFLDTPAVPAGSFLRILNARMGIYSPSVAVTSLGGLWTGLYICPAGTPPPNDFGGLESLPIRAPSSFPVGQQTINGYSDGEGDESTVANAEAAIDFDEEFIVPENAFVRACWSGLGAVAPPADSVIILNIQYIQEQNC